MDEDIKRIEGALKRARKKEDIIDDDPTVSFLSRLPAPTSSTTEKNHRKNPPFLW